MLFKEYNTKNTYKEINRREYITDTAYCQAIMKCVGVSVNDTDKDDSLEILKQIVERQKI